MQKIDGREKLGLLSSFITFLALYLWFYCTNSFRSCCTIDIFSVLQVSLTWCECDSHQTRKQDNTAFARTKKWVNVKLLTQRRYITRKQTHVICTRKLVKALLLLSHFWRNLWHGVDGHKNLREVPLVEMPDLLVGNKTVKQSLDSMLCSGRQWIYTQL